MNQRIFLNTIVLILFCALLGCKKDYPVASNGTPVFYFNGTVNSLPVNIKAGVNDYYMYSYVIQDINSGVYTFKGELKQTNCIDCTNSIKIEINDYKASSPNSPAVIDTSLKVAYYPFQPAIFFGAPTEFVVQFDSLPQGGTPQSYFWDFGDGTTDVSANPTHTYTHPGYYNVCLSITYSASCVSTICNEVKVEVPGDYFNVGIYAPSTTIDTIHFITIATGTAPYSYELNYGDGNITTGNTNGNINVSHYYAPGIYNAKVKMTDSDGYVSKASGNFATQGFAGCYTNFTFSPLGANANPFAFSNIVVTWTDNNSIIYSSNNVPQTNDSYFKIVSVENYTNNANNQPTKKLHIQFKCKLADSSGNIIQVNDGEAVVAVAYK